MRILVATDVTVSGGVDVYIRAYLSALRRQGHSPTLLFERHSGSAVGAEALQRGFDVIPLPLYRKWHQPERVETACRSVISRLQPDGIHVVTGSPRSCLTLRRLAIEFDIPLVITESQISEEVQFERWEWPTVRASYNAARAVVFLSSGNRDTMNSVLGLQGVTSLVIPNGVDITALAPYRKVDLRSRVPARILSVARLSPEKSLDTLIAAASLLPDNLVREVNIFGDGPVRAALERQAVAQGVGDRATLCGWTRAVPAQMGQHDLFVLPSLAEGMPYALLEAMAIGLPVVATDVPGNTEALADGAFGRIVPRANPEALAEGIRRCLTEPNRTEAMAHSALTHVQTHHARTTSMDATAGLWRQVPECATPTGQAWKHWRASGRSWELDVR